MYKTLTFTRSGRGYNKQSYPQFMGDVDSQTQTCNMLLLVKGTCYRTKFQLLIKVY